MVDHRGPIACTTIRHVTDRWPRGDANENDVTVHYWAAARSAAGVDAEHVTASSLAELLVEIGRRHRDSDRFDDVISYCSILVGETPVGARDPADVPLTAGDTVEFLPPFAGG
jgi:molybdopterin synthase sulfur carrier subunit